MPPDLCWEIIAGNPGNTLGEYFASTDQLIDFCGRLFYGNNLFEVLHISIRHIQNDKVEWPEPCEYESEWLMEIAHPGGKFRARQLASKHEVLCMMLTELRSGAFEISVSKTRL